MTNPENRENNGRNPDGTFKPGWSGNPGGRPKNPLKDYLRSKFAEMSNEEIEAWLKEHKVSGETQWKMAEGNPAQGLEGADGGDLFPNPVLVQFLNKDDKDNGDTGGVS